MSMDISTAGISAVLRASQTYPAGIALQGFAEDEAISVDSVQIADLIKSLDGQGASYVMQAVYTVNVTLLPNADAAKRLDFLAMAMQSSAQNGKKADELTLVISMPAQNTVVTFTGGILTNYSPLSGIKKALDNKTYTFKFENCITAAV